MKISDVVGLQLGDAKQILDSMNIEVGSIIVTSPPRERSGEYDDSYRVIRATEVEEKKVKLLVCKPL
jgi:hypothetical protein